MNEDELLKFLIEIVDVLFLWEELSSIKNWYRVLINIQFLISQNNIKLNLYLYYANTVERYD